MRRFVVGIALIVMVPAFSVGTGAEDLAPCFAGRVGVLAETSEFDAVPLANDSGTESSPTDSLAPINGSGMGGYEAVSLGLSRQCSARIDGVPQWQPTAPRTPAPLALDYVSGEWVGPDAFRVTWRTNHPSAGRLWWGPSGGAVVGYLEDGAFSEVHLAEIRGLEPGVAYSFQAAAIDRESAYVISLPLQTVVPTPSSPGPHVGVGAALAVAAGAAVGAFRWRTAHRR